VHKVTSIDVSHERRGDQFKCRFSGGQNAEGGDAEAEELCENQDDDGADPLPVHDHPDFEEFERHQQDKGNGKDDEGRLRRQARNESRQCRFHSLPGQEGDDDGLGASTARLR
jgi:hypothetical protein